MLLELCHEGLVCRRLLLGILAQQPGELAGGGQRWGSLRRNHGRVLAMRMDPLGDQRSCTRKTLVLYLTPQAGLIRTALRKAGLEVRDIGIDFPGATIAALVERESLGPDPTADGLPIEPTRCSNLAERLALGKAGLDLRIAVLPREFRRKFHRVDDLG